MKTTSPLSINESSTLEKNVSKYTIELSFLNIQEDRYSQRLKTLCGISQLKFKLSISKVERMENLNQTDFNLDISTNKLLMFRKL